MVEGLTVILKNNLKVLRAKNDLTQEESAPKVNVTRVTINSIERGQWMPSTALAIRIAKIFRVSVEAVFFRKTRFL